MQKRMILMILLVILTGCSNHHEIHPAQSVLEEPVGSQTRTEADKHLAYSTTELPCALETATAYCVTGDYVILGGLTQAGSQLAWRNLTDGAEGSLALPEEITYINGLCLDDAGFVLLGGTYPALYRNWDGTIGKTPNPEGRLWLVSYDTAGEPGSLLELQKTYTGHGSSFWQLLGVEDGWLLLSQQEVVKIGPDGAEQCRLDPLSEETRFYAMTMTDEGLCVLSGPQIQLGEGEFTLQVLDPATLEVRDDSTLLASDVACFGTAENGQVMLQYTAAGETKFRTWEQNSMEPAFQGYQPELNPCSDYASSLDWGYLFFTRNGRELELLLWQEDPAPERTVLNLAATGVNNMEQLVKGFNRAQSVYRVELKAYEESATGGGSSLDRLRTEVIAGNGPDLFCFNSYGVTGALITGGLEPSEVCLDLSAYLDADAAVSREDFVPGLLQTAENGAVFELPLAFYVTTLLAPSSLIQEMGATMEELERIRIQAGEDWVTFPSWMDANNLLALTASFCMETCMSEGATPENLAAYLQWCKDWSGDGSIPPQDQRAILHYRSIGSVESLAALSGWAENLFGDAAYAYAGIPVENGPGTMLEISSVVGISKQCSDPDGAWTFLCYCLEHQAEQSGRGLTTLTAVLREQMDELIRGGRTDWQGETISITQQEADQFWSLITEHAAVADYDETALSILQEEAAAYFAGNGSAADAARRIQDRIGLYWMERAG